MNFEEYRKAFYAGLAGLVIALMGWLQAPDADWRALVAALAGGFGAGFLGAFLPANKIKGKNVTTDAKAFNLLTAEKQERYRKFAAMNEKRET